MIAPTYQLSMRSGPKPGMTFPLEQEETLVGRDLANDIPISDAEVSRRHARFILQDDTVFIEDLGSTNGTFLNGERISSSKQLRAGDVITLGESIVMVFENATYDPDATVISSHADQADFAEPMPDAEPFQSEPESEAFIQPEPFAESPEAQQSITSLRAKKVKKGGLPTWLIILIIAIVVILCVIAVTLWFMPASWWCAVTFDMLEGCPIP